MLVLHMGFELISATEWLPTLHNGKEALGAIIWTGVRISTFPPGAVMREFFFIGKLLRLYNARPEEFFKCF
jgi:hypothetical protein